jgi:hypothetical protein
MPDYGNDPQFGTFVTPTVAQPEMPVALAEISEQAGLDLVTFQDHPYQPAFQDTWTLLSYVAARTRRVHLAPNVLSLPLRQPAVTARAAAGLDLLTGGRVELGLGAGAFWDPIVAMGGPRRSPGEAVEALAEAIEIIRGIWDVDERGVLKVAGKHYAVSGAKRGPAPAHPIGLWLGAYKPRMLRLIGRSGDGWLPSWGYLKSAADLTDGNEVIDEAATAAGRDPRSIRRLLNISGAFRPRSSGFLQGPVDQWVEELTGLVVEHGMDTFILAADDPGLIERYGAEVAPAVHEAVAAIRAGVPDSTETRSTDSDVAALASISAPVSAEYERLGVTPTTDPGVRLSADQPWDESARPHRAESGPNVRYTDQGRQVGAHLIEVHDMLRAELAQVRDLIDQVRTGALGIGAARSAISQMTMRQNNWTLGAYCASYCRVVTQHHSMEDKAVFPHLARQDADLAPVIQRLADEHVVIHEVLDGVDRALVALAADPAALDGVQQAADLLTDTLLSHLSYEEVELVEPLARLGFYPGQV